MGRLVSLLITFSLVACVPLQMPPGAEADFGVRVIQATNEIDALNDEVAIACCIEEDPAIRERRLLLTGKIAQSDVFYLGPPLITYDQAREYREQVRTTLVSLKVARRQWEQLGQEDISALDRSRRISQSVRRLLASSARGEE